MGRHLEWVDILKCSIPLHHCINKDNALPYTTSHITLHTLSTISIISYFSGHSSVCCNQLWLRIPWVYTWSECNLVITTKG